MDRIRLVLADDHAVVRAGIANALRELPNLDIVAEVGDGAALQTALEREQPALLVTDVTMPGFEPISAIRQIRAQFPRLKILIVSAYDDDVYVQGLLGAGVDGYHLKDQPLGDLRLAVQRVLAGDRWICGPLVDRLVRPRTTQVTLTARQQDLLRCLHDGLDNQGIARRTGLSVKTVENHLTRLYRQLNVQSRIEALRYLIEHPHVLNMNVPRMMAERVAPVGVPVLLVDDSLRYRTQMQRMLSKSCPQVQVYAAEDTMRALEMVREHRPRLAFVDVVLGDENGIDCTRQIKAVAPEIRIVLISAYPDREFHRLGLAAGAIAFLDKQDLNADVLREVIADQLN